MSRFPTTPVVGDVKTYVVSHTASTVDHNETFWGGIKQKKTYIPPSSHVIHCDKQNIYDQRKIPLHHFYNWFQSFKLFRRRKVELRHQVTPLLTKLTQSVVYYTSPFTDFTGTKVQILTLHIHTPDATDHVTERRQKWRQSLKEMQQDSTLPPPSCILPHELASLSIMIMKTELSSNVSAPTSYGNKHRHSDGGNWNPPVHTDTGHGNPPVLRTLTSVLRNVVFEQCCLPQVFCCLLWINKARTKDKKYIWVSVWRKTTN